MKARKRLLTSILVLFVGIGFMRELGWFSVQKEWPQGLVFGTKLPDSGINKPRLLWLGHSGFVLDWHQRRLLLDPNLNGRCGVSKRLLKPPFGPEQIGHVDAVLYSHAHFDHMDLPTLKAIPDIDLVIVPKNATYPQAVLPDVANLIELVHHNKFELGPLTITSVPAKHSGGRFHPFRSQNHAQGYIISDGDFTLYFAGDTAFGADFKMIRNVYAPNQAILPIGCYQPTQVLGKHHLSPDQAAKAARILGVTHVFPCHFGTFRLAFDAPMSSLEVFKSSARKLDLDWCVAPMASPELLESYSLIPEEWVAFENRQ